MTYDEILNEIRNIVKGNDYNPEIKEILTRHNCSYLLNIVDNTRANKLTATVNAVAVKERYKYMTPVIEAMREIPYAVIKPANKSQ